jgi:2-C-methyl-D-erythritol 4-phosphate cytidylyltransferase/2-C-methyl-D-erythritol 2,4-cyclodiphosphate synthase
LVAIHDAARPFVKAVDIAACLTTASTTGIDGAVLGVPLSDTIKRSDSSGAIAETVPRANLWRAQTPQVFRFAALLNAHRAVASLGASEATALTDDAAVAERAGLKVVMVQGSEDNRKITTADDLARSVAMETRAAFGFDVHGFGPGNAVMLGGVAIPHSQTLAGHSDADVALHALTDALWARSAPAISASTSRPPIRSGAAPPPTGFAPCRRVGERAGRQDRPSRSTLICELPASDRIARRWSAALPASPASAATG